MIHNGAIHSDLEEVRAQIIALSDCLSGLTAGNPPDRQTGRGLSLFTWHIVQDIDNILQEIENDG
ncbi:hypothetical protein FACS189493_7310 [Spirochaetia bacterium]|nr:hypothetical protein FACS189493_7310 [Spirochaetia bacterium]